MGLQFVVSGDICKDRIRANCFPYKIFESRDKSGFRIQSWSTSANSMMLNIAIYLIDQDFNSDLIAGNRKLTVPKKVQLKAEDKKIEKHRKQIEAIEETAKV